MAQTFKLLGEGVMAASEAAATVVNGVNAVPANTRWIAKVVLYNTGSTARIVTVGFHPSDASLVAGEYFMKAESLSGSERREFGIRSFPAGYTLRANQASGTDVQWEVIGYEENV
jgi:hypothetical protein